MKKFLFLSVVLALFITVTKANTADFYSYLTQKIEYPSNARVANHQGNSIITFSVSLGNVKNVNIQTELGKGCDIAVLNSVMAYPNFKSIKDGKYALKVAFRIQANKSVVLNEFSKMPIGFTALNTIYVIGYLPADQELSNASPMKSQIRIRGLGSVTKTPLIVLDGNIVDNSISELDPENIASISIIKDASAIAQYGIAAEHGVVVIASKKPVIASETTKGDVKGIIIRGTNGIIGKEPLYVIDGQIIENTSINDLEPNKIQTVEVLKDAASIALYGPNASNGVVLITTKKEVPQKTKK